MGSLEDNFVYALLGTSDFMLYPYITKYAFHVLVIFHTAILKDAKISATRIRMFSSVTVNVVYPYETL